MKVHGIKKDNTTICGEVITEDIRFWCTENYKNITCKRCKSNIEKVEADVTLQEPMITKKHCKTTELFMDKAITVLKYKGESRFKILEMMGMPHSTFVYLKQGKTKISLDKALKIADACELSLDYMCGRVDENGKLLV